jgi:thiol-disulfide isomerase/thioredoxin
VTPGADAAELRYQSVNLAVAVRDSFVYVLAFADSSKMTMRLDAFEASTGVLARTAIFPATTALLSLDEKGDVWSAPADTLNVIGAPVKPTLVEFRLPTPKGDTLDSRSLRGKVVLLNIWASWCEPCREEFPLMAQLTRELPPDDFAIVAVSEDRDENAASWFIGEFSPPFQIAWGRGALNSTLRFRGLPFTVLLDREGRIIQRYIGFGGPSQFARMRADIERAIANRPTAR